MTAVVELINIHRQFGSSKILSGIHLEVCAGEVVAIYGRSGSGKTTLVNLVGGLDEPDMGEIRIRGQSLSGLSANQLSELRRTQMGFVFQSYGLLSHLSALENVEYGLRLAGCPRQEWRARCTEALAAVGLLARARHSPGELSGGERQRVAVARVLAVRPSLVLADEPTGALDHATGLMIIALLISLARETGASVFIATHDVAIAERVDRAFTIDNGDLIIRSGMRNEL